MIFQRISSAVTSPRTQKWVNGVSTLGWLVLMPVTLFSSLKASLEWVVFMSLFANVATCLGAWVSSLVNEKAEAIHGHVRPDEEGSIDLVALWAALAMLAQDVIGVAYMQAANRNRAWLAGLLDALTWGVMIATTDIAVSALQGHNAHQKVVVIAAVSAANILGTALGVKLGKRFIHQEPDSQG